MAEPKGTLGSQPTQAPPFLLVSSFTPMNLKKKKKEKEKAEEGEVDNPDEVLPPK